MNKNNNQMEKKNNIKSKDMIKTNDNDELININEQQVEINLEEESNGIGCEIKVGP